jgi:hypothetical protein
MLLQMTLTGILLEITRESEMKSVYWKLGFAFRDNNAQSVKLLL